MAGMTDVSWWQCRWCFHLDFRVGRTVEEERDECLTHEANCPDRRERPVVIYQGSALHDFLSMPPEFGWSLALLAAGIVGGVMAMDGMTLPGVITMVVGFGGTVVLWVRG